MNSIIITILAGHKNVSLEVLLIYVSKKKKNKKKNEYLFVRRDRGKHMWLGRTSSPRGICSSSEFPHAPGNDFMETGVLASESRELAHFWMAKQPVHQRQPRGRRIFLVGVHLLGHIVNTSSQIYTI